MNTSSTRDARTPAISSAAELAERTLVCIPCHNRQGLIVEVIHAVLQHPDSDVLVIDDQSEQPLQEFINREFAGEPRVRVQRPAQKLYSGGGKNLGLKDSLDRGYGVCMLLDSDVVVGNDTLPQLVAYLRDNDQQVVVGAAILPYGNTPQFSDTLINFSKYLPQPGEKVSFKDYLAGYALAINTKLFRQAPCQFPNSIGGDDIIFCQRLRRNFRIDRFPLLNTARVTHKPPRTTMSHAVRAQLRYGTAFFSHIADPQNSLFRRLPMLHLLTPRVLLMVLRLLRSRRYRDLRFAPVCWYLDLRRALRIVQLATTGFVYPKY